MKYEDPRNLVATVQLDGIIFMNILLDLGVIIIIVTFKAFDFLGLHELITTTMIF